MGTLIYKPDIYVGRDPYICISYHPSDRERVWPILEQLDHRGFRFWLNDGIAPGMDADEVIAEHIEGCDFFIAFLSDAYLATMDMVDELNFSRDVGKDYLLVYLEDVLLPPGLDMRFTRAQNVQAYAMESEEVFRQLISIEAADRFYGIADASLRPKAQKLFEMLDALYPEHKVFALDAVAKQLAKKISQLYIQAGYPSVERLLLDYGFTQISSRDARVLRSSVLYAPGSEPETVKPRIDFIMTTLAVDYPDKQISDNLSKSHRAIYSSLMGLSLWLGYDSVADMLSAYGFTGGVADVGRGMTDYQAIIDTLTQRYAGRQKPERLGQLMADHPDLAAGLKTMQNRAYELFGMTLLQYFKSIGLLYVAERGELPTKTSLNRQNLILRMQGLYEQRGDYGRFADAEESLQSIVIRENAKQQIYVTDCTAGSGIMRLPLGIDFIASEAFADQADITQLILPPGLREIQDGAFLNCSGLERIVFGEGIERIGADAFAGCSALKQVCIPASVKYIGSRAFADCGQLAEAEFGNPRINIREDAFEGCIFELAQLQSNVASAAEFFQLKVEKKNTAKILAYTGDEEVVMIPGMIGGHPIVSVEKGCFKGNTTIREVYFDDQIEGLNGDVFKDCINLEKVHLPNAVAKFTASAFAGCTGLSEVNIPDSMADVPRGLFKDSPLTTVYIGKGVKNLSPDAFYKGDMDAITGLSVKKRVLETVVVDAENECFTAVGTMLLSKDGTRLVAELGDPADALVPEGVEEICAQAYEKAAGLTQVAFPSTLRRIAEKAFAGTGLTRVEFPASVESIADEAFSYCRSLTAAEFCEGLRSIGQQAFTGCPIGEVFLPATVEQLGNDSFLAISTYRGQIEQRFSIDSANAHLVTDGVALYLRSEAGLTLLKAYHRDLRPLPGEMPASPVSYTVKAGTVSIAPHAFAMCTNLAAVQLPEGLAAIGDMAFSNCRSLTEIHIPESCSALSPKAFLGTNVNRI